MLKRGVVKSTFLYLYVYYILMILCTLEQLLGMGVHIGSPRRLWDSTTKVYTLCIRKGLVILNMRYTLENLKSAVFLLTKVGQLSGSLLFVCNEIFVNFGIIAGFILNVGFYSGFPLGGIISNYRAVWPVVYTQKLKGKLVSTNVSGLIGLPEVIVSMSEQFHNAGVEASNVGAASVGFSGSTSSPNKFMYTLPGASDSVFLGLFLLRVCFSGLREGRYLGRLQFMPSLNQIQKEFSYFLEILRVMVCWFSVTRSKEILLSVTKRVLYQFCGLVSLSYSNFYFFAFVHFRFFLEIYYLSSYFSFVTARTSFNLNKIPSLSNFIFQYWWLSYVQAPLFSLVSYDFNVFFFVSRIHSIVFYYVFFISFFKKYVVFLNDVIFDLFCMLAEDVNFKEITIELFLCTFSNFVFDLFEFFFSFCFIRSSFSLLIELQLYHNWFYGFSNIIYLQDRVLTLLQNSVLKLEDLQNFLKFLEVTSKDVTLYNIKKVIPLSNFI